MSVAYSRNLAYDRRFEETAEGWKPVETPVRPSATKKQAVLLRRTLVMVTAIVAAAVCIGLLYMKAQVFKTQREINNIRSQIAAADKLNGNLSEQLSEATNINTIMERATALGMGYPDSSQMLYVSLGGSKPNVEMKK